MSEPRAPDRRLIVKLAAIAVLAIVAVILLILYRETFSYEATLKKVELRWQQLQMLAVPDGARVVSDSTNGGAHYYGIDCQRTAVLEITGLSRAAGVENVVEQLKLHYLKWLQEWHPELSTRSESGVYTILQGEPGAVYLQIETFWYDDAEQKTYKGPGAGAVLATYPRADGQGRRFATIVLLICTR